MFPSIMVTCCAMEPMTAFLFPENFTRNAYKNCINSNRGTKRADERIYCPDMEVIDKPNLAIGFLLALLLSLALKSLGSEQIMHTASDTARNIHQARSQAVNECVDGIRSGQSHITSKQLPMNISQSNKIQIEQPAMQLIVIEHSLLFLFYFFSVIGVYRNHDSRYNRARAEIFSESRESTRSERNLNFIEISCMINGQALSCDFI